MTIKIIKKPISKTELLDIAKNQFGDFVKAVIDVGKEIIAVGGELHADEETLLLQNGSRQENLWGINIYPEKSEEEWIAFDSMINIRPSSGNRSRGVENLKMQEKIKTIIKKLILAILFLLLGIYNLLMKGVVMTFVLDWLIGLKQ